MAVIGSLGGVAFSVSANQVKTFNGLKQSISAQYQTHNRHLKDALIEFTGNSPDKITFTMTLSVFLGVKPQTEISKLKEAARAGKIMRLVIGRENFGNWVIPSLSIDYEHIDKSGNILSARISVTLTSYAGR